MLVKMWNNVLSHAIWPSNSTYRYLLKIIHSDVQQKAYTSMYIVAIISNS